MKIDSFLVNSFAREEYTVNQTPQKDALDGDDLLIMGQNKSGKSLTFAAIAHVILGRESPLDLSIGGGNDVSVGFNNGSKMYRGAPMRKFETQEQQGEKAIGKLYEKDEADEKLRKELGAVPIIKTHFLSSEPQFLPLERYDGMDRINLIQSAVDRSAKLKLDRLEEERGKLQKRETKVSDSLQPLEDDLSKLNRQLSQFNGQKKDWQNVVELSESGRLEEIQAMLLENSQIHSQLNDLSKRVRGLKRKITSKKKEIDEIRRYENSVEEIIAKALTEFVCPVCDGKVDTDTAKRRMSSGSCPFCNEDRSASQIKQHIREQKEEVEGRPGKLSTEIAELKTERNQAQEKIQDLKEQLPAISELETFVVNELRNYESIDELEDEATSELKKIKEKQNECQAKLDKTESEFQETKEMLNQIRKEKEEIEAEIAQLKKQEFRQRISSFEETLNNHFTEMGGEVGEASTIILNGDNGEIELHSQDSEPRKYHRRSELSGSEIQLLNTAFVLSLNDHSTASGAVNFELILLDEPFSNLDNEVTESTLDYLQGLPQQIIVTSSNKEISSRFAPEQILHLTRSNTTQAQVSEFN